MALKGEMPACTTDSSVHSEVKLRGNVKIESSVLLILTMWEIYVTTTFFFPSPDAKSLLTFVPTLLMASSQKTDFAPKYF